MGALPYRTTYRVVAEVIGFHSPTEAMAKFGIDREMNVGEYVNTDAVDITHEVATEFYHKFMADPRIGDVRIESSMVTDWIPAQPLDPAEAV